MEQICANMNYKQRKLNFRRLNYIYNGSDGRRQVRAIQDAKDAKREVKGGSIVFDPGSLVPGTSLRRAPKSHETIL